MAAGERIGLDLRSHRSRVIDAPMLAAADLVVTMEQRHVLEVATVLPEAFNWAFTLPDLVQRSEAAGPRADRDLRRWLTAIDDPKRRAQILRFTPDLEVPDPMGGTKRTFRRCTELLVDLVDRFMAVTWPEDLSTREHGASARPVPGSS